MRDAVTVFGHFGEWLQGRMGEDGPVALVTLPCPVLRVHAPAEARSEPPLFDPADLRRFAQLLGIAPDFPNASRNFAPGLGAGASTATLVALARAAGFRGDAGPLAAACLAIEGATDPLMHPQPDRLLWASREARVLRHLPPPPPCEILGGFWGTPQRTDPSDSGFDDISDLVAQWEDPTCDLTRRAALASDSARRCSARRGPACPTPDLAREFGALGWLRAHTGSARGLIFAPGTVPARAADTLAEAGLTGSLRFGAGEA